MAYTKRNFTFKRFINEPGPIEGTEGEVSMHGGICVPWDLILSRDLSMGVFAQGGATVTTHVEPDIIPFLRAKTICGRLGATILAGLKMPNAFPVFTGDFQSQWLAEAQTATSADVAIAQMAFSPHRVSATINVSTMLVGQAAGDFEDIVRREMTKKLFQALDLAALNGTGGAQPIGLLNTNGTNQVTFAGVPTWAKVMSFPQAVENSNADIDGAALGFALSPNAKFVWRTTQRASGSSTYLCEGNRVGGIYSVESSTELNAANGGDRAIFGNWTDLYLGTFGQGVWCNIDPYSLSKNNERIITCHLYADVGTPRPQSFSVSQDSAAA